MINYEDMPLDEKVRMALQYSRNYLATWPNMDGSSYEHIEGLCNLLEELQKGRVAT